MALVTIDLDEIRGFGLADLLALALFAALLGGALVLGRSWGAPFEAQAAIALDPRSLFTCSLLSLGRAAAALLLSLGLALWWGLWAARSRRAERLLLPLVDILQSIPVLGFMPGLVLALLGLFPRSRVGLELAAVGLLVSGQAWGLVLGFYKSCTSIPRDLRDAAESAGLKGWRRFLALELPAGASELVFNAMLAMAGGWFFLMAVETFQLQGREFRLPGLGSFLAAAAEQGRWEAVGWALGAMGLIVIAVDQLAWRPLLSLAWRFRLEEGEAPAPASWAADFLRRSVRLRRLAESLGRQSFSLLRRGLRRPLAAPLLGPLRAGGRLLRPRLELLALGLGLGLLGWAAWRLLSLLENLALADWLDLAGQAGWTALRIAGATLLATALALPLGVHLGLEARRLRWAQPLIQIAASYPATMLFPALAAAAAWLAARSPAGAALGGLGLDWGAAALMAAAVFWPLLFNLIAGAASIPAERRLAWAAYGSRGWSRWRRFLLPGLLPSLLGGWETAAVAGFNASVVTEALRLGGEGLYARGLGAAITRATESGDFSLLTAAVLLLVAMNLAANRLLWHRLFDLAKRLQE